MHLDVNVGSRDMDRDARRARVGEEVERAAELGATRLRTIDEPHGYCVVMQDPEGNEFCLQ